MSWLPLRGRNLAKVPKQPKTELKEDGKKQRCNEEKRLNFNKITHLEIKTSECEEPLYHAGNKVCTTKKGGLIDGNLMLGYFAYA